MPDMSNLDQRYFIDWAIYNCPFCKRRHVSYLVESHIAFDWTEDKTAHVYIAKCFSCSKRSMHLSFEEVPLDGTHWQRGFRFDTTLTDLDDKFFYSVPSSRFVLDSNIPATIRDLFTEAEGCLKNSSSTGASACARKIIFELAMLARVDGAHHEDRIKSLKAKYSAVEPTYFDTLLTIHELTSTKVHENSLDSWEASHLRVMLAAIAEVLHEIYVLPREKEREAA